VSREAISPPRPCLSKLGEYVTLLFFGYTNLYVTLELHIFKTEINYNYFGTIIIFVIIFLRLFTRYTRQTSREAISPPRPCYLPISEPIPVPCQRNAAPQQPPQSPSTNTARSGGSSVVPRSQPISMKRSVDSHRNHPPSIGSLSPPSVQFVIGTPPGRRYGCAFEQIQIVRISSFFFANF